jgi:hypothetical protein
MNVYKHSFNGPLTMQVKQIGLRPKMKKEIGL